MIKSRIRLSDQLIDKLRDYIRENNLKVGDRLPTERDLAVEFGVSRVSIREVTKVLGFFGLIDSLQGRGLTIGTMDMSRIGEMLTFFFDQADFPKPELLRARVVIERGSFPYVIEAISNDPNIYKNLTDLCDQCEHAPDRNAFIEYDSLFHRALVEASHVMPLAVFNKVIQEFFVRFQEDVTKDREGWTQGARLHKKIVEALKKGDLAAAEKFFNSHVEVYSKR